MANDCADKQEVRLEKLNTLIQNRKDNGTLTPTQQEKAISLLLKYVAFDRAEDTEINKP